VFCGEDLCAYGGRYRFSTVLYVRFDRAARCRFFRHVRTSRWSASLLACKSGLAVTNERDREEP
jgi:hypothetical protein